ncbi:hypothetical protein M406DRAFT_258833 [Cryphonectria parasitica EP155]|uniref:DNA replication regulator Sld3 C-terminal domain-containing protein n=1 Tax=Cryphonectria parasitica (strain ATCC 38755 / EP155) TaxID=660469 RepID=A0A9P5CNB0_CRYP1|nr:uncharacterized protein M406DRAFT_258833 [Cryphonectria parasitica EP155]KAF3764973.1 hypothetical protein M406DRAFT_258833 [Cryphonectria parasitica EP155]
MEQLLRPPITVKVSQSPVTKDKLSCGSSDCFILTAQQPEFSLAGISQNAVLLKPLMLLSRECLSLSSLDLVRPAGELPSGAGRFFESHIRILELEGRLRQAPSVLIARSDTTGYVYAVERAQAGRYVVCKLGSWVRIEKLSLLAEACYEPRCHPARAAQAVDAEAPAITLNQHKDNKKKRQAIEELRSMVSKRPRAMSVALSESQVVQSQALGSSQIPGQEIPTPAPGLANAGLDADSIVATPQGSQPGPLDSNVDTQATLEEILQTIRSQYAQALYHSKGSLAYFAKGPLSKARSAFQFDCETNLDMNDLVNFLKGLVIGIPQIDKKYRETVPALIDDMKVLVESNDEEEPRPKRRKAKKMKLGKDGLWTNEVDDVKKWWRSNKPAVRDEDSSIDPREIKYHVSFLRTRETQLQMILLLEILALEAVHPAQDAQDSLLPGISVEDLPKEQPVGTAPKKKEKHDYSLLVNLHADRMSIWQSTTLDEMKMIAAEAEAKRGQSSRGADRADSDPLKDFCIDIIVPFFVGRLPDLCADLNKKLGGPVAASPPRSKSTATSAVTKPKPKPGSAAKRPTPAPGPKSLEKVFESDQQKRKASRRPIDVLARMRSATPAVIPGLKREASEPLGLDRVPSYDGSLRERPRNTLSRSASSAGAEELKAQKKITLEAELQEAISALKKPNRQLAGRSIVEEVEKRVGARAEQKKPVRNAAAASRVQVKATPANFRFRDAVAGDARGFGTFNAPMQRTGFDLIPSSSSVIPGTAPRKSFRDDLRDDLATFHIASTPDKVCATPAAARMGAPQLEQSIANDTCIPPSSPIMSRKKATPAQSHLSIPEEPDTGPSSPVLPRIFETPAKQRSTPFPTSMDENITSTPPKPRPSMDILFVTPAKRVSTSVPAETTEATLNDTTKVTNNHSAPTLYEQMGWNSDYDDLF